MPLMTENGDGETFEKTSESPVLIATPALAETTDLVVTLTVPVEDDGNETPTISETPKAAAVHAVLFGVRITQVRIGRDTCLLPIMSLASTATQAHPSFKLFAKASNCVPAQRNPSFLMGPTVQMDGKLAE